MEATLHCNVPCKHPSCWTKTVVRKHPSCPQTNRRKLRLAKRLPEALSSRRAGFTILSTKSKTPSRSSTSSVGGFGFRRIALPRCCFVPFSIHTAASKPTNPPQKLTATRSFSRPRRHDRYRPGGSILLSIKSPGQPDESIRACKNDLGKGLLFQCRIALSPSHKSSCGTSLKCVGKSE